MAILEKLGRLLKLGFFVGAGTTIALVSACSSAVKNLDTGPVKRDGPTQDVGKLDGGDKDTEKHDAARDAGVADRPTRDSAPRDLGKRDKRSWDIPLE